jgi:thioredoxin 1
LYKDLVIMNLIKSTILTSTIFFAAVVAAMAQTQQLKAEAFNTSFKHTPNAQLLDVRTPEEFSKGHLEGADNINWNDKSFSDKVAQLDKDKPLFVYCLAGGRSAAAVKKLSELGFKEIYDLEGGIMAWRAKELPEVTPSTALKGMSLVDYTKMTQGEELVLIDFYATWCGPCKKMKPYLERIDKNKKLKVRVERIDVDQHAELVKLLNIGAVPVLKLYKDQKEMWQHEGYISEKDLNKKLKSVK